MVNGYFGKILWINLANDTFKEEELADREYRQYLGGYGLAAKLIYERMPAKTDALGSDAIFGFFPGLLTGTIAPLTGRNFIAGKSPLTGTWGDSSSGGYIGAEIKKCGYDAILIEGVANTPKYVSIIDGKKEILDASDLWGLDTIQTEEKLIEKYGNVRVASIGVAGENLSLISGIVNDKGRIAARSGFGAVMGSKKLKAVVLKGSNKVNVANKEGLLDYTKKFNTAIANDKAGASFSYKNLGLCMLNVSSGLSGDAPVKNWGGNSSEDFPVDKLNKISASEINKYKQKEYGCFSCSVQCGAIMKIPEANIEETHIPEYETCAAFGHMLLNDDVISLFIINDLCNRAGLDTISAGGTIAFAIECYDNGLISLEDTDGLELKWGNSGVIIELIKKIIKREGIGDILADGPKKAAEIIGKGAEQYAIHSMGQPLAMHDPKIYPSLARTYAFDPTPGRHTAASLDHFITGLMRRNKLVNEFMIPRGIRKQGENRYEAMKMTSGYHQAINGLGLCYFTYWFQTYPLLECIKAILGWDLSFDDVIKIGLRIQTIRQAFTIREGIELVNNKLPGRVIGAPPFESGPHMGKTIDYKTDYKGYCEKLGWNPDDGVPLKKTLKDLDLEFIIKDLY